MTKRILILDDDRDFARVVAQRCQEMGIIADIAECSSDATLRVNLATPDMVCVDVDPQTNDSLTFCEYLAWNPETRSLPLLVLTEEQHIETIRRCCSVEARFIAKSGDCWESLRTEIATTLGVGEAVVL